MNLNILLDNDILNSQPHLSHKGFYQSILMIHYLLKEITSFL